MNTKNPNAKSSSKVNPKSKAAVNTKPPKLGVVAAPAKVASKATAKARSKTAPPAGVVKEVKATKQAVKRPVKNGQRASEVVVLNGNVTNPVKPTTQNEWDAMVLIAGSEHKAYETWVRGGRQGGAKQTPKRPNLDLLKACKAEGMKRDDLPAGKPKATARKNGSKRASGEAIPEGKTSAGLDRMDDDAIKAWVIKTDKAAKTQAGPNSLHRQFREAGFGANAKRFAKLVESARKQAAK